MATYGYALSSEEHAPLDLVRYARRAEENGFSFVGLSDHFHPWVSEQGHSPFVWSIVGALAAATERIGVGIGVTCPLVRIHPAVLAQAAATSERLLPGRFFFGVGTGEALNEHILGDRWPPADVRLAMLEEAVEVMRGMWRGETYDHHGTYYTVENAKLFDPPQGPIPVVVSAFGPLAADVAARIGDGFWGTSPSKELLDGYAAAGGAGPRYAQITLCWAADRDAAVQTAHRVWPNVGIKGQLSQDLPTWTHFEQAAAMVTADVVAEAMPCGPDADAVVDEVQQYLDAGYDHIYFHQVGPDQEGFFRFWQEELAPRLT